MKKRLISLILILALLIPNVSMLANGADAETATPNIDMLESMLHGERSWVLDTLLQANYSTNPVSIGYNLQDEPSMALKVLNDFDEIDEDSATKSALYKGMVICMEKYYNATDYVNGLLNKFVDEENNLTESAAELFPSLASFNEKLDNLTKSASECKYDGLLKAMYSETFISSTGESLDVAEQTLEWAQEAAIILQFASAYNQLINAGLVNPVSGESLTTDYLGPMDEAASAYLDSLKAFLPEETEEEEEEEEEDEDEDEDDDEEDEDDDEEDEEQEEEGLTDAQQEMLIDLSVSLAELGLLMQIVPNNTEEYAGTLKEYFGTEIQEFFNATGNALEFAENSLQDYITMDLICSRLDALIGPTTRLAENTKDEDLASSIATYNGYLIEQANDKKLSIDSVVYKVRENNYAAELLKDGVNKLMDKLKIIEEDAQTDVMLLISIAAWVANSAVGLEETCIKTYQLKYWYRMLNETINMYYRDLDYYNTDKTEENAAVVLEDLLFLRRLWIFGDKLAYDMTAAQLDTWIGKLFWDGYNTTWLTDLYQHHVDALIAASPVPVTQGITVPEGATFTLDYKDGCYIGRLTKDGKTSYYADILYRLAIGLDVDGTVFLNAQNEDIVIGYLDLGGSAQCKLSGGTYLVTELHQSGNTRIVVDDNAGLRVLDHLYINGLTLESATSLQTKHATLTGTYTGPTICISGDATLNDFTTQSSLSLNGSKAQTVRTLSESTVDTLWFQNTSASTTMSGKLYVRSMVADPVSVVNDGECVVLRSGGTVYGNYYRSDLTMENPYFTKDLHFGGTLWIQGDGRFDGALQVDGGYYAIGSSASTQSFNGGTPYIAGDCYVPSTTLTGSDEIRIGGDLTMNSNTAFGEMRIILCGGGTQHLTGSNSIRNLTVANQSEQGVFFDDIITVTDSLTHESGTIQNGENCQLSEGTVLEIVQVEEPNPETTSELESAIWPGNLTSVGWSPTEDLEIQGTFYAQNGLTLQDCALTVDELTDLSGSITIAEDASLTAMQDTECSGSLSCNGTLRLRRDAVLKTISGSGTISAGGTLSTEGGSICTLELTGALPQTVSGSALTVDTLRILSDGKAGVTLQSTITVNQSYENESVPVTNGENLILRGSLPNELYSSITFDAQTLSQDVIIHGNLVSNGALTLNGCTLTVGKQCNASGSVTIAEDAAFTVQEDCVCNGSLCCDGTLTLKRDAALSTLSGSGSITAFGCISTGGGSFDTLLLNGKTAQTVSGSTLTVRALTINNPSKDGIVLNSNIIVLEDYVNRNSTVQNGNYLTIQGLCTETLLGDLEMQNATLTEDTAIQGDLTVTGTLTLEDCALTVNGTVSASGNIIIGEGASLIISEDATLNASVENNGTLTIARDAQIQTLTGSGTVQICGDLYASNRWNSYSGALNFCGKTVQHISGSSISASDLTFQNTSRSGVWLETTVRYTGECRPNGTVLHGETYLQAA